MTSHAWKGAAFDAFKESLDYRTSVRWLADYPERAEDCLWRAFLAGCNAVPDRALEGHVELCQRKARPA